MKKISDKYTIYGRKKGRKKIHSVNKDFFVNYKNKCKIYSPLKTSKSLYPQILSLPLFPQITKNEMNSVIDVLKKQQK